MKVYRYFGRRLECDQFIAKVRRAVGLSSLHERLAENS
jgi:hypothetical protein